MSNHALFSGYSEQGRHVQDTEALVVNRATLVVDTMVAMRVNFLYLWALMEVVLGDDIVNALVAAPVNEVGEHKLNLLNVELAGAAKTEYIMVIEMKSLQVCDARRHNPLFKMCCDLVLLRARVAHEAGVNAFFRCTGPKWHVDCNLFEINSSD